MVASQKEEILRVLDFVGEEQADGLHGLLAPVHVVSQEEVVSVWREGTILEQTQQVRVLPVNVAWGKGVKGEKGLICLQFKLNWITFLASSLNMLKASGVSNDKNNTTLPPSLLLLMGVCIAWIYQTHHRWSQEPPVPAELAGRERSLWKSCRVPGLLEP